MVVELGIRKHQESGSQSDPSIFAELDSRTQRGAFRGLAAAAIMYAAAYFVAFLAFWVLEIAKAGGFVLPPIFDTVATTLAIAFAGFVARWCRRTTCEACAFTHMAVAFLVVSSLLISLQTWGWQTVSRFEVEAVSWVGVWLVGYPSIVTLAPRQILLGSVLGALTLPAVAALSLIVTGVPADFEGSPWIQILTLAAPVLICAGLGYAIAYRVFRLARDVSKARRLGSYQLIERLGVGGMGEVWRAQHRMLVRPAAVKLIRPQSLGHADDGTAARRAMRRFEREAQATALLTSPHSIVLYDFGTSEDGMFYYVMELLEGRDLRSLVLESGPLPAERVVHFLRAACDSLEDAHYRDLIHRDIKPGNLFTCRQGRRFDHLKVLDFGLVKDMSGTGTDGVSAQFTGEGVTSGTPGFMAPEMVTSDGAIDGRADIYSLGCVAYWLLTGKLVFEGKTPMSILVQHARETPPPMSSRTEIEIPPRLERVVQACLAKPPKDRPQTAAALDEMLAAVATELSPWTQERAEKWWQTNLPHLYAAPVTKRLQTSPTVINA